MFYVINSIGGLSKLLNQCCQFSRKSVRFGGFCFYFAENFCIWRTADFLADFYASVGGLFSKSRILKTILLNQSPWVLGTDFDIKVLGPLQSHLAIKKVAMLAKYAEICCLWFRKLYMLLAASVAKILQWKRLRMTSYLFVRRLAPPKSLNRILGIRLWLIRVQLT